MKSYTPKAAQPTNQPAATAKGGGHFVDNRPKTALQMKLQEGTIQKKVNSTGLPDTLKAGIENLSGHSMDDVKVHYNSPRPAQLQAHAYAQGSQIHIAPGQEKHLPHEAWHVVQQKQGRVRPTMQLKAGVAVNDDKGLEKEADVMGGKAVMGFSEGTKVNTYNSIVRQTSPPILQAEWESKDNGAYSIWTPAIDGVTWYADKDGMWFEITHEHEIVEGKKKHIDANEADAEKAVELKGVVIGYKALAGPGEKRPYEEWKQLYHGQLLAKVTAIKGRISEYGGKNFTRKKGLLGAYTYVDDTDFNGDQSKQPTHFENSYSQQQIKMRENYKGNLQGVNASDVFFHQFTAASGGHHPRILPKIRRDTIVNIKTKETLISIYEDIFKEGVQPENCQILPTDKHYESLIATPNGKATINILSDFNAFNRLDRSKGTLGLHTYKVSYIAIEKKAQWNMTFHFVAAD